MVTNHLLREHLELSGNTIESDPAQSALAALSSTNRVLHEFVTPSLYRHPVLRSPEDVARFGRTFERWINPWTMRALQRGERELPQICSLAFQFTSGIIHPEPEQDNTFCVPCRTGLERPFDQLSRLLVGTISHFRHLASLSFVECAIPEVLLVELLAPHQPMRTQLQSFVFIGVCVPVVALAWILEAPTIFGIRLVRPALNHWYDPQYPSGDITVGEEFWERLDAMDYEAFRQLDWTWNSMRWAIVDQEDFQTTRFKNLRKLALSISMDDCAELQAILNTAMFCNLRELVVHSSPTPFRIDAIDCLTIRHAVSPSLGREPGRLQGGSEHEIMEAWPPLTMKEREDYQKEAGEYFGPRLDLLDLGPLVVHFL